MGLSVCRTCVGSSDYSTEAFTYNEGDPDPDLKRFSIEHDRPYVLPILRQARKTNPDLFLFSSPWTPPGWMKSNKSMLGGNMQRHYMASYRSPLNEQLRDAATRNWPVFRQTLLLPTGHYPYATVQILSNGLPATQDHGPHSSLKSAKVRHIWPTRDPAYISTLSCRTNAFATRALGEHGEGLLTPILCGERERTRLAELR
jgi:hypothetical protein